MKEFWLETIKNTFISKFGSVFGGLYLDALKTQRRT